MKTVLCKLSLLVPILFGMMWINWSVDPVMLYDHHFDDPSRHPYVGIITEDLLAGKPHSTAGFYSERLVDEVMFRRRPAIDVLVLGPSTAKPIHGELFAGQPLFNASIYGGRLEEMVSIWEVARSCGVRPKRVLLQLDAGYLGRRQWPISLEWSSIYRQACRRLLGDDDISDPETSHAPLIDPRIPGEQASGFASANGFLHPYDTLISPRYLQLSLLLLWTKWSSANAVPEMFKAEDRHTLFPDGSVQWCERWRSRRPIELRQATEKSQVPVLAAEWMRPVENQRRLFEAFVLGIQKSGARVEFVLLPSNPWYYVLAQDEFRREGKILPSVETEAYLRAFAERHGILIHGSLDPAKVGVIEEDFVDILHMRRESVARLFASDLRDRRPH